MNDVLFFYQCKGCKSTAVSVIRHDKDMRPLCCPLPLCNRYMTYMWSIPVVTPQQREWADRGLVFNPGQQ